MHSAFSSKIFTAAIADCTPRNAFHVSKAPVQNKNIGREMSMYLSLAITGPISA